jgi:hypothetical protein
VRSTGEASRRSFGSKDCGGDPHAFRRGFFNNNSDGGCFGIPYGQRLLTLTEDLDIFIDHLYSLPNDDRRNVLGSSGLSLVWLGIWNTAHSFFGVSVCSEVSLPGTIARDGGSD